ncbi:MAG: MATE family efflux transporter, partial [Blautia producta]
GTMSGCILNMILDPFFILPWGLGMGAAGAGLATFLSNCFACCYFFVLLMVRKKKTNINLNPKYLSLTKEIVFGVMEVGIPAAIQNLLNVTGMTILNNFVAGYGSSAVAAVGIAQKVYMVPIQVALGGTQGVMPLVGYSYASKNKQRFEETIQTVMKLLVPCMVLIMILCWIFAPSLIRLFMKNEEVITYGAMFLRGFCMCMPFMLVDFLAVSVFESVGMGKTALVFAILRKIVFEIPAIVILNKIFQASGITYAGFVSEFILSIFAVILLRRIADGFERRNEK